jgi:hypothetical protein
MKSGNKSVVPQIFSELLSAAALNRQYDIAKRRNQASDYHDVRKICNHVFSALTDLFPGFRHSVGALYNDNPHCTIPLWVS